MYSPRSDRGEYILIDGTGSVVKTTKVRRGRPRLTPSRRKKQAVPNAWGSKSNSQVSLEKTPSHKASTRSGTLSRSPTPGKKDGKKGTDYYSDSFSSDSSLSRSRSRSRSKQKTCELHLKYTKNEKLLEWLKSKDQVERMHKRQQRKERREKRKAEELKHEEVEKLKEKSKQKVDEWMKMKKKEARLLRREQRTSFLDQKSTIDELVVIDEMLDLREHGARIDPSLVPEGLKVIIERPESEKRAEESEKCESVGHAPKRPSSCRPSSSQATVRVSRRPQSAVNLLFGRPVSGKKGRFSEGAKEKVRLHKEKVLKEQELEQKRRNSYNDWLKSKQNSKPLKSPQDPNTKSKVTPKEVVAHEHSSATQKTAVEVKAEHSSPVNHLTDKGKHIIRGADSKARPKTSKERVRITKQPSIPAPPPQTDAEVVKSGESLGTPRPKIKKGEAYNAVKQDQKSWDNFADHVWKHTNEEEHHVENEAQCRPEPQGSDMPDKVKALSTNSDDITAIAAESVPQLSDISQGSRNNERHTPVTEAEEQASHPEVESRNTDTRINDDDNQQPNEALDTKGKPNLAAEPTVEIGASVYSITGRSRSSRSSSKSELEVTGGSAFITAPE